MVGSANKSGVLRGQNEALAGVVGVLRAARKQWAIIVACLVLGSGLSLIYAKSLPRVYRAQTTLELDPSAFRPLSEKMDNVMPLGSDSYLDTQEYYETQYKIITSSRVMERTARDTGLANDYAFFGLKEAPSKPITVEAAGQALRLHVIVEPVKNSRLVNINVEDVDPKRAKRLAEAVANAFIEQNLEKAVNATNDAVVWLTGQVDQTKKDLEANENSIHEFKRANDLPSTSINETSNMVRLEMQDLNSALTRTRTRKQELLARHSELSKVSADNPDTLPASELLSSSYLQELRKQYIDAVRTRKSLIAEGKGDNHPQVKVADQKLAEARSALLGEIKNIQGAVERDLAVVQREEAGEAALYEAAHKRAVELNMKEIEYHRLDRVRGQNEKVYGMLLEHVKDADLARMMKANNIHLIESAVEPTVPVRPRVSLNVAVGALIGMLFGFGIGWVRNSLDNTIRTHEHIEEELGITVLGILPALVDEVPRKGRKVTRPAAGPLKAPELVVHHSPTSGIAEAARSIRTNLLFTNPDRPYRKLLISSAAPSEGKTTVACSIAIALAQSGQRVCIIDCDLRRPRLHRIFGRAGDAGVTNVLVGEATIGDVARPTEIENLWCIPSGPIPPNPADLLHSERFKKFLEDAGEAFDRIIIDSPPLVAVTDSAIISTLTDGTVFVLRSASTSRALAYQGMRTLADVDAPVVGAVLNAVDFSRNDYSYYQQYYYYRREGYAPRDADADDPSPPSNRDAASA
jgi:succinoglycan biosynthesis transport protein ExoP